ncbi:MAG TPA: PDZ domain-containing protein, partial [Polyangiales bacterium]
ELRVQLGRAATLGGFVVDILGRAVPGAFVSTTEGESSNETDGQGAFTLAGVPPGPHTLLAHHARAGDGRSAEVRARASERLDGIRIALNGRYQGEADASVPRAKEERSKPPELGLEQRGRVFVVTQVLPGGLASKAGLRVGDVLSAVDGEVPLSAAHARGMLRDPPGRVATVRVLRDRRPVQLRYKRPAL